MSSGQTLLAVAAMMFLTTILLGFFRIVGNTGDDIASGQDGILAVTINTSYQEIAQGLAFDSYTDTSDRALTIPSVLTAPEALGPESADEDSIQDFNDFDDFDGYVMDRDAGNTGRRYRTRFKVHYVHPIDITHISSSRQFVKRMDLETWRIRPVPTPGSRVDTVRMSTVLGYFHFD